MDANSEALAFNSKAVGGPNQGRDSSRGVRVIGALVTEGGGDFTVEGRLSSYI